MIVQEREGVDPDVIGPSRGLARHAARALPYIDFLPARLWRRAAGAPFSPGWFPSGLPGKVRRLAPDVVHLHWVAAGTLSAGDVSVLPGPLVWTLHDMWPFTGGCHYDGGCDRFTKYCGPCPVLGSRAGWDLSRISWWRKRAAFDREDLTVIAPSRWLAEQARRSSILGSRDIRVIPNPLDLQAFKPADRAQARASLDLPPGRPVVMFAALHATDDARKGFRHLEAALRWLQYSEAKPIALVAGATGPGRERELPVEARYLGTIADDSKLTAAFSAADVFVAPSEQENLSNTVAEALACGTPCVAFRVGGMEDLIEHDRGGMLAEPLDEQDLARCIATILADTPERRAVRSAAARERIAALCDMSEVARRHLELYEEVIDLDRRRG